MNRMPMNPQLADLLREGARAGRRPLHSIGITAAREQIDARAKPCDVPLASIVDETIEHEGRAIPQRVYEPLDPEGGTIVFAHGGGWVLGSIDSHDGIAQRLALHSKARVISVDYRLAPEYPFPAGLDDVAVALERASERFGGPIALAGDSAGANLATVLARHDRDSGRRMVRAQLLIYPVADSDLTRPSYGEREDEPALENLTADDMAWCWAQYVPVPGSRDDPDVAPIKADSVKELPPAIVVVAGHDALRDEGVEYAQQMSGAGVQVRLHEHADLCHGFLAFLDRLPAADKTIERVATELGELLRRSL